MPLRLVMMGTGDFAVPTFKALYDTPHEVIALFTQPDRTGRGHHRSHVNGMKQVALERGTAVFQPQNVNTPEALDDLRKLNADVFVVAAYGQILSVELLGIPRLGSINVHASLLPKYRGAAPILYAVLNGDAETGVSIIQILPQLDAGPILAVARTPIGAEETTGELEERLSQLAVPLLAPVLGQLATGTITPLVQEPAQVTRAPKLKKEMGLVDWSKTARQIDCHVRAMQPWPNAFSYLHSADKTPQRLLILAIRPASAGNNSAVPGTVLAASPESWCVRCGDGAVEIVRVQPDGKRPMTTAEFLRGRAVSPGDRFAGEVCGC